MNYEATINPAAQVPVFASDSVGYRRPATGDRRPATGDRRPATGDWRLATGHWPLAFETNAGLNLDPNP